MLRLNRVMNLAACGPQKNTKKAVQQLLQTLNSVF